MFKNLVINLGNEIKTFVESQVEPMTAELIKKLEDEFDVPVLKTVYDIEAVDFNGLAIKALSDFVQTTIDGDIYGVDGSVLWSFSAVVGCELANKDFIEKNWEAEMLVDIEVSRLYYSGVTTIEF